MQGGGNSGIGADAQDSSLTPRLSRHSHSFLQKKLQKGAKKDLNGRVDFLKSSSKHQQRSLQCLTTFDCPVCHLKDRVRVDLNTKDQQAVVRCTHCTSLRPRPSDLPYPFSTSFVPKLENRADVFFKFSELYRGLGRQTATSEDLQYCDGIDKRDNSGSFPSEGVLAISSTLLASGAVAAPERASGSNSEEEEEEEEVKVNEEDADPLDGDSGVVDVHAFFDDSD